MRVLSQRELNRATLARQLLLERRRLAPARVIERLVGMQAQWPAAPYVGIWSRSPGFRRDALERELRRGTIVKATVMRSTLHLVTRRDYAVLRAALRDMRTWADDVSADAERVAPLVRTFVAAGPVSAREALEHLEREHGLTDVHARRVWHGARVRAHVVHHHETALWSARPQALFVALDEPEDVAVEAARAEVVRRYLAAFGPASRADLADWSGMRVSEFAAAIDALEPLRRFRDEAGRELLDAPRAPLPDADTPAPPRFLPKWDNVLLGFADRRRILPEEYRKTVIAKNGDVAQTFLVDGVVAGTWRAERGRVVLEPFAPLPRAARRELEEERARLEAWLA